MQVNFPEECGGAGVQTGSVPKRKKKTKRALKEEEDFEELTSPPTNRQATGGKEHPSYLRNCSLCSRKAVAPWEQEGGGGAGMS